MKSELLTPAETSALEAQAAGVELTAQYRRAVSGMREVLIFGAMLMQVEAKLVQRGPVSAGGRGNTGGLREFLRENAPEIAHSTAFRFLGIARAVAEEYEAIVGARIAKKYDLPALVLSEPEKLPEPVKAKQLELFDYISGTSQRSWLDSWREKQAPGIGGDTRKIDPATGKPVAHPRKPLDERLEIARITARDNLKAVCNGLAALLDKPATGFALLSKDEQDVLRGAFIDYGRRLKALK